MSASFTQLYVHIIFAVSGKKSMLNSSNENEVHQYIAHIAEKQGHDILIINGTFDHIHLLLKFNPTHSISDLVRDIKKQSSFFINHTLVKGKRFNWEKGFRAFTHARSQINSLYKFIEKQKEYHRDVKFKEEYLSLSEQQDDNIDDISIFKYIYP